MRSPTFLFPAGHARPLGLLANGQLEVSAISAQHGQWEPWTVRVKSRDQEEGILRPTSAIPSEELKRPETSKHSSQDGDGTGSAEA